MAQVLRFPAQRDIGFSQPIERKTVASAYSAIKPTVRQSVAWLFFDGERSVRRIQKMYRSERISEHQVEDILREHHRSRVAVALNAGRLRAAMGRAA